MLGLEELHPMRNFFNCCRLLVVIRVLANRLEVLSFMVTDAFDGSRFVRYQAFLADQRTKNQGQFSN